MRDLVEEPHADHVVLEHELEHLAGPGRAAAATADRLPAAGPTTRGGRRGVVDIHALVRIGSLHRQRVLTLQRVHGAHSAVHVTVLGAPAALIAPPVETPFERVPHIRTTLLLICVHLLLVVHPAVEVDLSLSLSLVGVLHVSTSLLLPAVPGSPALLHRYPVPVGVIPEPGRAVLRAPRIVMLILRRALQPAELVRTVHAPTPAATHGVAPVRAGPANHGVAAVHAHVTHRARGTIHRRVGAARAAAEETILMHERSGVPAPAALARSPVVEHTPVNGALLVPLIAAAGQDAARLRTERLERVLQPALLRLEAPTGPPRDAEVAADSLERGRADAEVLRGFLEMFREVFLEHLERDAPRRLGVSRGPRDAKVGRVDVRQRPAEGVEVADVRRDGLPAGARILGIAGGAVHRDG
mmetsp:Transcript_3238/g.14036  ORF Transcript_3238/g.14036 Transcript_3238/m.14036 type:complete len:414 (-) Transcript_3238:1801-3042(-)